MASQYACNFILCVLEMPLKLTKNKTTAKVFTPSDEKKMGERCMFDLFETLSSRPRSHRYILIDICDGICQNLSF